MMCGTVKCEECGKIVPIIEASRQVTFEGEHIRCEPCADAAYQRAIKHMMKPASGYGEGTER